jgi:hypothetical protein
MVFLSLGKNAPGKAYLRAKQAAEKLASLKGTAFRPYITPV